LGRLDGLNGATAADGVKTVVPVRDLERRAEMRLRILPMLIVMAVAMLGMRLGDIWTGFGGIAVAQSGDSEAFVEDPFRDVQMAQAEAEAQADSAGGAAQGNAASENGADPDIETAQRQQTAAKPDEPMRSEDPLAMSDAEIEVLQQLSERRAELDRREEALEESEQLLEAARKRLEEDIARLEDLKTEIEGLLIEYDNQESKQLKRLVNIYSNMDSEDAARIFEDLDMKVLLKVVDRMNERRTAPILAEMESAKAQALTLELAKRKDLPVPNGGD
jgi:flagellar motility protein MotE (MotC chaperone)